MTKFVSHKAWQLIASGSVDILCSMLCAQTSALVSVPGEQATRLCGEVFRPSARCCFLIVEPFSVLHQKEWLWHSKFQLGILTKGIPTNVTPPGTDLSVAVGARRASDEEGSDGCACLEPLPPHHHALPHADNFTDDVNFAASGSRFPEGNFAGRATLLKAEVLDP